MNNPSRRGGPGGWRGNYIRTRGGRGGPRLPNPIPDPVQLKLPLFDRNSLKKLLPGYDLYFIEDFPAHLADLPKKVQVIIDYLQRHNYCSKDNLVKIEQKEYFEVLSEQVFNDAVTMKEWPSFLNDLELNPDAIVTLWSVVMHKIISDAAQTKEETDDDNPGTNNNDMMFAAHGNVGIIHAGLMKKDPVMSINKINLAFIGKFITVEGIVLGSGSIKGMCIQMAFLCKICQTEFSLKQPDGIYTLPIKCGVSVECKNKNQFEPVETSLKTLVTNIRNIRLQDRQTLDGCALPKIIDCELKSCLVDECTTGDAITLTGIVRIKKEAETSLHHFYIQVIALRNHKSNERTMGGQVGSFGNTDYCAISRIQSTPKLFRLLVASICPAICGHEVVKAAIILALFGGTEADENDLVLRRSDINLLIIGDPGIGKSQILKIIAEISPRGIYICGTGCTIAGLTATMIKDGNEYSVEPGALVMANNGVCCIDEFDKMKDAHPALLEVMEQQSVTITKSGVNRTLAARTSIIAAANPHDGHYNKSKSLIENIKITKALLSRFDVTFVLLDEPNKINDKKISSHIMGFPAESDKGTAVASMLQNPSSKIHVPLLDRLKVPLNENIDRIPHQLIRKYVAYARQYVKPKLSTEAAAVLKEYYLKLRDNQKTVTSLPVTTRQLESLKRLTEARAKLELRTTATTEDAQEIIEIFESALSNVLFSNDELLDFVVNELQPSSSKNVSVRAAAKNLLSGLKTCATAQSKTIFTSTEIKEIAMQLGIRNSLEGLIDTLNDQGFLLAKGDKRYQLHA